CCFVPGTKRQRLQPCAAKGKRRTPEVNATGRWQQNRSHFVADACAAHSSRAATTGQLRQFLYLQCGGLWSYVLLSKRQNCSWKSGGYFEGSPGCRYSRS